MLCLAEAAVTPGDAVRRARSLAASASTPRARVSPARRGEEKRTRVRGSGGHAFDRLVRDQNHAFDAPAYDEAEAALDAFWLAMGVREEAYRARLVAQGAPRDHTTDRDADHDFSSLYRDPERLSRALLRLQTLFPESNVADMCWKEPDVLCASPRDVAASLVTLRFALPGSDVVKIVQGQPRLLLGENAARAGAAAAALRRAFPKIDVSAVADAEPSLLTPECDVLGRLGRLERLRSKDELSPSVAVFAEGGAGARNATLFAKVFLEETARGAAARGRGKVGEDFRAM